MCDVLIPALIGVAALGLLGGNGVAGGCDNCPPDPVCAVTQVGNHTITIPQLAGEGTNVVQVSAQESYGYAPQQNMGYAPQPNYGYAASAPGPVGPPPAPGYPTAYGPPAGYPAPAPYPDPYMDPNAGVGASINYDGQSAIGAGAYSDPNSVGIGANVGDLDASVGLGAQTY